MWNVVVACPGDRPIADLAEEIGMWLDTRLMEFTEIKPLHCLAGKVFFVVALTTQTDADRFRQEFDLPPRPHPKPLDLRG